MKLQPYVFSRKCDIGLCQNTSNYYLDLGAKGKLLLCKEHAIELAKATQSLLKKSSQTDKSKLVK